MPPISYTKGFANWEDKPSTATKTTAAKYNNFETGISQLYELYNAAGDLAVGAGADQLDRLAAPTVNDHVLVADTAQTLKMKWAAVPTGGLIPLSLIDASGDLIVGSGADAATRLALGSNDEVLSVNSGALDYRKIVSAMFESVAWTSYTPTWGSSGTQPSIGNGGIAGRWIRFGRLVIAHIHMSLGSSSSVGTGNYTWSLPVQADTALHSFMTLGAGRYFDNSASDHWTIVGHLANGSTSINGLYTNATGDLLGAAAPVVPASGDAYQFCLTYEAAS